MLRLIATLLLLAGCTKVHSEPKITPAPKPVTDVRSVYVTRLITQQLVNGQVVSVAPDGSSLSQGDSQVFNGAALYGLDCAEGSTLDDALLAMVEKEGGAYVRYEPLPQKYVDTKDQATFDTAVGVDLGVAVRLARCNEEGKWHDAYQKHLDYVAAHGQQIYDGTGATVPPGFDLLPALIAERLGLGGNPPGGQLQTLEELAVGWATADVGAKAACYRLNLIEMTFTAVELLGVHPGQGTVDALCELTKGAQLPVWDHRCGRRPLEAWLTGDWVEGAWEYRHQRCGAWEGPDGAGARRPYVDWLYGYQRQYGEGI